MDVFLLAAQLSVVIAAIIVGVRTGGVGIGLWGGIGCVALVVIFQVPLGTPPIDALLIIVAVVLAASTMQACGGIDWMVSVAARAINLRPRSVSIVAPLVSFVFAICAGTSNILFSLLPVIQEVSVRAGIRPSKPLSVSVVATSVALACSPVSAAMAVMIAITDSMATSWTLPMIIAITAPSAVAGIVITGLFVARFGGEDPSPSHESGASAPSAADTPLPPASRRGKAAALLYLGGVLLVVLYAVLPNLRPVTSEGEPAAVGTLIQLIMLSTAAVIALVGRPTMHQIPTMEIFRGGMVAALAFFGLAWMIDTFLQAQTHIVESGLQAWIATWPPAAAIGIFVVAVLTTSQSTATRMIVPLALTAGVPYALTAGLWVGALGGIYLLPTNGLQIAAAQIDTTGSTRLGRHLIDHSFFVPSLILTVTTTTVGAGVGWLLNALI